MIEAALILIKPDGVSRGLIGNILSKFDESGLKLVGIRMIKATKEQAEEHYKELKDTPFFEDIVNYLIGKFHRRKEVFVAVYVGKNAIKKCRKTAGATNPEDADPMSIRGAYGRITTKGLYENVVHVSSTKIEAKREIKLWFSPDEIAANLYLTKIKKFTNYKRRVWI